MSWTTYNLLFSRSSLGQRSDAAGHRPPPHPPHRHPLPLHLHHPPGFTLPRVCMLAAVRLLEIVTMSLFRFSAQLLRFQQEINGLYAPEVLEWFQIQNHFNQVCSDFQNICQIMPHNLRSSLARHLDSTGCWGWTWRAPFAWRMLPLGSRYVNFV